MPYSTSTHEYFDEFSGEAGEIETNRTFLSLRFRLPL